MPSPHPRFSPEASSAPSRRATYLREGFLLLGFLLLLAASVVTVALPELSDASDREPADSPTPAASPDAGL